jgi:hypothetical protein
VEACRGESGCGVWLDFRPERSRIDVDEITDYADLGPEHCVPSVRGIGKVVRILRAAKLAPPDDSLRMLGDVEGVTALLERALGTVVRLEVRPRTRMRFTAWTEEGVETVDGVAEVLETPDALLIFLQRGRHPLRIPRSRIVRHQLESERWYEVTQIDRLD